MKKNNFINITIIVLLALTLTATHINAQVSESSFILNLYYNQGLLFEPDSESGLLTISPSAESFVAPSRSYPLYKAVLLDINNRVVQESKIDQLGGNTTLKNGLVKMQVPFSLDTRKIIIYNENDAQIISLNVGLNNLCNTNKVCETALGENKQTCQYDCAVQQTAAQASQTPTANAPTQPSSSGNAFTIIIWIFSGIVLVAGIVMIYMAKKGRDQ